MNHDMECGGKCKICGEDCMYADIACNQKDCRCFEHMNTDYADVLAERIRETVNERAE